MPNQPSQLSHPGHPGYDQLSDMQLKEYGNGSFDLIRKLSGLNPNASHAFAVATCHAAFGVLPIGDGPNKLSDDEVRDLIPVVKAARASLVILAAILAQRA
jgi:hypothetical protein